MTDRIKKMRVFYGFPDPGTLHRPVVTVGSFDGVHVGHRAILDRIRALAGERNGESVAVTFDPHPRTVLGGDPPPLLSTLPEKLDLLESAGADAVVVVRFTPEFSRLSSQEFIARYLMERLAMDTLLVGYDHRLGRDKEGDYDSLLPMSLRMGFGLERMPCRQVSGHSVSSTLIRRLVGEGRMDEAAVCLGAPYLLKARTDRSGVLSEIPVGKLLPPPGRYPSEIRSPDRIRKAVLEIDTARDVCLREADGLSEGPITVKFI